MLRREFFFKERQQKRPEVARTGSELLAGQSRKKREEPRFQGRHSWTRHDKVERRVKINVHTWSESKNNRGKKQGHDATDTNQLCDHHVTKKIPLNATCAETENSTENKCCQAISTLHALVNLCSRALWAFLWGDHRDKLFV